MLEADDFIIDEAAEKPKNAPKMFFLRHDGMSAEMILSGISKQKYQQRPVIRDLPIRFMRDFLLNVEFYGSIMLIFSFFYLRDLSLPMLSKDIASGFVTNVTFALVASVAVSLTIVEFRKLHDLYQNGKLIIGKAVDSFEGVKNRQIITVKFTFENPDGKHIEGKQSRGGNFEDCSHLKPRYGTSVAILYLNDSNYRLL